MIVAIAESYVKALYRRPGGFVINTDSTPPRREDWGTLSWKCYLMEPNRYQRFLQLGFPIVPMSWRFKHQDSAFLPNTNNIYPNFDEMSSDTPPLDFDSVVQPLLDLLADPDNGAKDTIPSWFLGIFQSMDLPIVRNHFAQEPHTMSIPRLPDYSAIKSLARSGDNFLGNFVGILIEDNPADIMLFHSLSNTPESISKLRLYDDTTKGVKADLKGSCLVGDSHHFAAATGNRDDYWEGHQDTMYIFLKTSYSGEKSIGFALGKELLEKFNGLPEQTRNKGGGMGFEELRDTYGVEFYPQGVAVQRLQSRCNALIEDANWAGRSTMMEENLASARHSKKLKAMGLINLVKTLEEVEGVRAKLGAAQASKVNITVYHTQPGGEESLVALVTVVNTLVQLTQAGASRMNSYPFRVKSDTGAGAGSALFPSASSKRLIISSIFTAKTDAGEHWAGEVEGDSGDIRNYVLTRQRTYVIGMGSPQIHEETWGKDVRDNPGGWRGFVHGDKVLVRFADDPYSAAMRMMVYESEERGIGGEVCFQELVENDAPIKLSASHDYESDGSNVEMTVDPDPWERGSAKLLAHTPGARSKSNLQRTVICGVIERVNKYGGESNSRLGMFVGASRVKKDSMRPTNVGAAAISNAKGVTLSDTAGVAGQLALGECGNTGEEIFKRIAELAGYDLADNEDVVPMGVDEDAEVD
ncbi:hypothetical protein TrRE_jg4394 [Triparma retinervis]|uniref:Uncharacterized protein n=1 Tax=Triparma retinervis TaxID=2557542 RepID=A0A9W7ADB3_9STRA|nr:hypothetical protein TrRE_jg4394 [Triparma retinervis]